MINSRDVKLLKPYVKYLCDKFIKECKKQGVEILITSTVRDAEYQLNLYAQGRTKPGKKVTNSKYIGAHGFGLAFDVVPIVNGKAIWNNAELWNKIGLIGTSMGLEWGGNWKTITDKPHFQYVQGLNDVQLRAGKLPKFPVIPQKPEQIHKEEFDIMNYNIQPIAEGKINTTTLGCKAEPTNNLPNNGLLRPSNRFKIYAKVYSDGYDWYLINIGAVKQWVVSKSVDLV